ncbi:MAG: Hsp20/alpha crystallin family protein [Deltaproteobacteria bacterium]|nr:Hsp20/alpha crystallin family protein [Deltaproteobacteria bacterium]MBW1957468.1 Hsp20/alpha crystallin family protein [Deltaproteobacteria bacterium]MBW2087694.1 Hsp20/alpha crystallin family protein [Deltaproteobacteria bacterium]
MELIRWNPRRELFGLHNRFNRMFDEFFSPTVRSDEIMSVRGWSPVVDIYENEENIVITAELPGVDKKDMTVDVKGRILTLKGERSTHDEVKEDNYYRQERCYGKFERCFTLPVEVDPEKIKADYKDGVLKIDIPKVEESKPKQVTIH